MAKALVVGGTGMLAEATRWLARQGWDITLLSRSPQALADEIDARAVPFDWAQPQNLEDLATDFDLALVWLHDGAVHLARRIEDHLKPGGRVVRVHGALSADPAVCARREPDPRPGLVRQRVLLGWYPDPQGGKQWLNNQDISTGTCFALAHADRKLVQIGACAGP